MGAAPKAIVCVSPAITYVFVIDPAPPRLLAERFAGYVPLADGVPETAPFTLFTKTLGGRVVPA